MHLSLIYFRTEKDRIENIVDKKARSKVTSTTPPKNQMLVHIAKLRDLYSHNTYYPWEISERHPIMHRILTVDLNYR